MSITYSNGWIIVQGDYSGSDDIFGQIFDESVSQGWGIESQQKNYMELAPTNGVQFGANDQTLETIAVSKNENVLIVSKPIKCLGNASYATSLTLGEYSSSDDLTLNGTILKFTNNAASYLNSIDITDQYSTFNSYASKIYVLGTGLVQYNWINFNGPVEVIDTGFFGQTSQKSANIWFKGTTGTLKRIKLTEGNFGLITSISTPIYSNIICNDNGYGFGAFAAGTGEGITAKNSRESAAICTYDVGELGYTFNFLNCVIDNSNVTYLYPVDTGLQLLEQFTIDLKIIEKNGNPVEGVRIRAWDSSQNPLTDTPKFDVSTAADGTITQQTITISKNIYDNQYTNYNPFTFFIYRAGWKELWLKETITEELDCTLSLSDFTPEQIGD